MNSGKRRAGEEMDANTIVQLIGSLGFPIVCCIALFWRMIKSDENHKTEIDKLTDALNNNTLVLQQLSDLLRGKSNE